MLEINFFKKLQKAPTIHIEEDKFNGSNKPNIIAK